MKVWQAGLALVVVLSVAGLVTLSPGSVPSPQSTDSSAVLNSVGRRDEAKASVVTSNAYIGSSRADVVTGIDNSRERSQELFEKYRLFHISSKQSPEKYNYIIYEANEHAGLGNRLNFLITSFFIAIMTGRVLLIEWPTNQKFAAKYEDLFDLPEGMILNAQGVEYSTYLNKPVGGVGDRSFEDPYGFPLQAACEKNYGLEHQVERLRGYSNWVELLSKNPHHVSSPLILSMDTETLYADLLLWLVRPNTEVERITNSIISQFQGSTVVGLQIRLGLSATVDDMPSTGKTELQKSKYMKCAYAVGYSGANKRPVKNTSDSSTIRFFIASDQRGIKHEIQRSLAADVIFQDEDAARDTVDGIRKAVADIWALGRCDELVISARSSYGVLAAALHAVWHQKNRSYMIGANGLCFQRTALMPTLNSSFRDSSYADYLRCWTWTNVDINLLNSIDSSEVMSLTL